MIKKFLLLVLFLFQFLLFNIVLEDNKLFGDEAKKAVVTIYPFGNSTALIDSTNYIKIRKGWYVGDSLFVGKDGYIRGKLYLDTNKQAQLYYNGYDFILKNSKSNGTFNIVIGKGGGLAAETNLMIGTVDNNLLMLDSTNGIRMQYGNIGFMISNNTGQIKTVMDTATDYNLDDAITLNNQFGILTTKSLTTGSGLSYTLIYTNSLISSQSGIIISEMNGSNTRSPVSFKSTPSSGSCSIAMWNGSGSSLNGTIRISVLINNK